MGDFPGSNGENDCPELSFRSSRKSKLRTNKPTCLRKLTRFSHWGRILRVRWICSWLTNANFGTVYSVSLSKATEGTGMWFIESEEFVRWKRGELKILWGTGKRESKVLQSRVSRVHGTKRSAGTIRRAILPNLGGYPPSRESATSWVKSTSISGPGRL